MRGNQTISRPGLLDGPQDYVVVAVVSVVVVAGGGVWATGQLAGLLFRGSWPRVSFGQALLAAVALPRHWADPRQAWPSAVRPHLPGLTGFVVAAFLVTAVLVSAATAAIRWAATHRSDRGMASPAKLKRVLSETAVARRGQVIRPSLKETKISVTDVGVRVGASIPAGIPLAVSAEDSALLMAAPRIGKSSQLIIPWLHEWPGPALVTSIRLDVLLATATLRARNGPVAVMAPTGMITWPERMRWCPTSGCGQGPYPRRRDGRGGEVGGHLGFQRRRVLRAQRD
jgi:hypothetical protein